MEILPQRSLENSSLSHRSLDRNLGLDLARATEAAAMAALGWVGRGRKNEADAAAVEAMRNLLATVPFIGRVVIGEGEKDNAPMLYNGETLGNGSGQEYDVAVDPIDGTSLTAQGRQNALSVLAVAPKGSMLNPSCCFYMEKLASSKIGAGVISLNQSIRENIVEFAKASKRPTDSIMVAILDRPRHQELIEEVRSVGAKTRLLLDGDVAGAINAARPASRIDLLMGVGGSPEAVIASAALQAIGGYFEGRFAPTSKSEIDAIYKQGMSPEASYTIDDFVAPGDTYFIATGVTDSSLLRGVVETEAEFETESLIWRSATGTRRKIVSHYKRA